MTFDAFALLALLAFVPLRAEFRAYRPIWRGLPETRRFDEKGIVIPHKSEPPAGWLRHVQGEALDRREALHGKRGAWLKLIDEAEYARIRQCTRTVARYEQDKRYYDRFAARRCKSPYCPWCGPWNHYARTIYEAEKCASLMPGPRAEPHVLNLVFEVPKPFHDLARHNPTVLPAVLKAIRRTIAGAYHYTGDKKLSAEQRCWNEMGAFVHFHAIGDKGTPWPHWMPHYDIIIPAWRRHKGEMMPIRRSWPELLARTHARYRDELRHALLPIVQSGPARNIELQAYLMTDFDIMWHASRNPRDKKSFVLTVPGIAMHRIAYSCRPLVETRRGWVLQGEDGSLHLRYVPPAKRGEPIIHTVPLGPAAGQVRSLHPFLFGRESKRTIGILKGPAYKASCKLAGHAPIRERSTPRGKERINAIYDVDNESFTVRKLDPHTYQPTPEQPEN